jgi:peptidoglycan/LPS O-acetylase OafA/YrhL
MRLGPVLLTYRDDIDGLRAVAVILIVFYHARLTSVPGGFVGVDVFFVISGFLITGLITREIAQGQFSFGNFYMRRLRRLGPALLVTLALTLVAGWFILPPGLYQATAQAAIAGIFSVGNIFFWHQTGYFDTASAYKPLLHIWSLSVEEQFYFVWPTLLLLAARYLGKSGLIAAIIALSIVSLIASEALLRSSPSSVFFFTPFRIFEFGLGALLAIGGWQARNVLTANAASLGGLLAIFYVAGNYQEATPFPGLNALLPAGAAALMIYGGPTAIMNRAIAIAPVKYIGQISYSVYLVHWPLFVYYIFVFGEAKTSTEVLGLIALALGFGAVMYHCVETPFRHKTNNRFTVPSRAIGWGSLIAAAVISLASWQIHTERGYATRFPPEMIALLDDLEVAFDQRTESTREFTCNATANSGDRYFEIFESCLPTGQDNIIVVLGDSHAADVYMGLKAAFPNKSIVQLTGNGCNMTKRPDGTTFCAPFMSFWQTWLGDNAANIDAIIYTQSGGSLISQGPGGVEYPDPNKLAEMDRNLQQYTTDDVPFFFWGPRPGFQPTIDIAIIGSEDRDALRTYYQDTSFGADFTLDDRLERHFAEDDVHYISTVDTLCRPLCPVLTEDDALFIVDYGHWSEQGAISASHSMINEMPELKAIFQE